MLHGWRRCAGVWATLRLVVSCAAGTLAAAFAAWRALLSADPAVPELVLARTVLAFLAVLVVTSRAVEIVLGGQRPLYWPPHEAQTQADET
jgi:hypothetical protein